uniref:Uncharacterized protein n=1 Tax=Strix occidentalis caurina TaxID=311401 RepID=A0A8D0KZS9_STROC
MAAAGPGAAGAARVSSGRDLSCVPEVAGALGAVARQGLEHPHRGETLALDPARLPPGTRAEELRGRHAAGAEFWGVPGAPGVPAAP